MHTSGKRLNDGEVVRRTLQLQLAIATFGGGCFGVTMLVHRTGLPAGTVHRYLSVFVEEDTVERCHTPLLAHGYRAVAMAETLRRRVHKRRSMEEQNA